MSGPEKLIRSVLDCSRISYFSDHIERRTLDGNGFLAPFIGLFRDGESIGVFRVSDLGEDHTNLVVQEVTNEEIPAGLIEYEVFKFSENFNGPLYEIYDNYLVDGNLFRNFSSFSFNDGGSVCKISVSEDAPTLFEVSISKSLW